MEFDIKYLDEVKKIVGVEIRQDREIVVVIAKVCGESFTTV